MSLDVGNCPRCGRLFAKQYYDVCNHCTKEIEAQYEQCKEYLREHSGATITQLSDETGVSIKQITKFIREGRISLKDAPNMSYPCESCGVLIREHHLCGECRKRLTKQVQRVTEDLQKTDKHISPMNPQQSYQIRQKEDW